MHRFICYILSSIFNVLLYFSKLFKETRFDINWQQKPFLREVSSGAVANRTTIGIRVYDIVHFVRTLSFLSLVEFIFDTDYSS
jgi:hypothetical protein